MIKKILGIVILVTTVINTVNATDQNDPYELMNMIIQKTFDRVKNEQSKILFNPDYLRDVVDQEIIPYIQIKYVGALILGNNYKDITSIQRENYFFAFGEYLKQIYGQILTMYHGQDYRIEPKRPIDRDTIIVPILVSIFNEKNQLPVQLIFQWRKNSQSGKWQICDIVIEGISMVITKKKEWHNILHNKGVDELIKQIQSIAKKKITLDGKSNEKST